MLPGIWVQNQGLIHSNVFDILNCINNTAFKIFLVIIVTASRKDSFFYKSETQRSYNAKNHCLGELLR